MIEKRGNINCCGVYAIKDYRGKIKYIGSSAEIANRFSTHKKNLIDGKYYETNKHDLQVLFNTEDLLFCVLKECKEDELIKEETKYIKIHRDTIVNKDIKGKRRKSKPTKEETKRRRKANTGENNPNCYKLNERDVKEIKMLLLKGIRQSEIAKQYCVSQTLIYNIKIGKRWKHVEV